MRLSLIASLVGATLVGVVFSGCAPSSPNSGTGQSSANATVIAQQVQQTVTAMKGPVAGQATAPSSAVAPARPPTTAPAPRSAPAAPTQRVAQAVPTAALPQPWLKLSVGKVLEGTDINQLPVTNLGEDPQEFLKLVDKGYKAVATVLWIRNLSANWQMLNWFNFGNGGPFQFRDSKGGVYGGQILIARSEGYSGPGGVTTIPPQGSFRVVIRGQIPEERQVESIQAAVSGTGQPAPVVTLLPPNSNDVPDGFLPPQAMDKLATPGSLDFPGVANLSSVVATKNSDGTISLSMTLTNNGNQSDYFGNMCDAAVDFFDVNGWYGQGDLLVTDRSSLFTGDDLPNDDLLPPDKSLSRTVKLLARPQPPSTLIPMTPPYLIVLNVTLGTNILHSLSPLEPKTVTKTGRIVMVVK